MAEPRYTCMYFTITERHVVLAKEFVVDGTLADCEVAMNRLKRLYSGTVSFMTEQELRSHLAEIERRRQAKALRG
jgi:hypothetical protein